MDIEHRVRTYAGEVVGDCSPDRITAVSRFDSGERHAVYKVSYLDPDGGSNDLVVRISSSDDASERAQAEREAKVLEKVQGFAAPVLHDFRGESPWFDVPTMCMQFVPGEQRELTVVAPKDVERLGAVVGWIHGLPADDLVEWFPDTGTPAAYRDGRVAQIVRTMPPAGDGLPASVHRRLDRAVALVSESWERARSVESFGDDEHLVLLHGDVAGGNIIWGPEPVLIDWEYTRLGDRADEVAYTFTQNGLSASQRRAFWRGYRKSTDPQLRLEQVVERVGWWEPLTLLGSALWWVERWSRRADADAAGHIDPATPKAQHYYRVQAIGRLDRFEELFDGGPHASG